MLLQVGAQKRGVDPMAVISPQAPSFLPNQWFWTISAASVGLAHRNKHHTPYLLLVPEGHESPSYEI